MRGDMRLSTIEITGFTVIQCQAEVHNKKAGAEEVLSIETARGIIYIRRSSIAQGEVGWNRLKNRMQNLAREKSIPFRNEE